MAKTKSILSGKAKSLLKKNKKSGSGFKVDLGGGGGGFPAGIEFGTAKITKMEIGQYKSGSMKDENYFMVRGVCVSPKVSAAYSHKWSDEDGKSIEHDLGTVKVKGLQDSLIMEPLCDTPNRKRATEEEHYQYMFGILEGLGIDMQEIEDDDDLKAAFEAIIEEGKTVNFRTWSGGASEQYPDANVNVSITGFGESEEETEDDDDDDDDDMEVEDDEDEDEENEDSEDDEEDSEDEEDDEEDEGEEEAEEDVPFGDELDMIVDDCNDDDSKTQEKSQKKLVKMATDAGIEDPEDEDEFPTWESVAAKIRELSEDDEDEDDEEPEVPEKGQVVKYKPPRGKLAQYTVTSVNRRKGIVALKNKAGKIYKEVPFDKLS